MYLIMDKLLKSKIESFRKFALNDINSAIKELEGINTEGNRKHLQRLVYANLVDRFDILVDELLLEFAIQTDNEFHNTVLSKVSNVSVPKSDYFEAMLSDDPRELIRQQIQTIVRNEFTRERHSKKLRTLLSICFDTSTNDLDSSRVNANDGRVQVTFARRSPTVPSTLIGYSDYLYAKRSGIVHGTGTKISKRDAEYLNKNFKATTTTIGIKIGSIKSAAQFYIHLCDYLLSGKWTPSRNHKPKKK